MPARCGLGRWRRFGQLSWPERWLLCQALVLLPGLALALKVSGFHGLHALLGRWSQPNSSPDSSPDKPRAQVVARWVDVAARRGLFRPNCLHRSLTLWWLLRRRGLEAELRIGVRKGSEHMEAHAWVEYAGEVLNDAQAVRQDYVPFPSAIVPAGARLR